MTNYPTTKDVFTNPAATDKVSVVSHADQHANANDAIEALQTKVGIDGSAVTSTHDYKLSDITGTDKAIADSEYDAKMTVLDTADTQNVKITTDQTVAGVKTFSSSPIVPTPTTDFQTSTKKYVDDATAGAGGGYANGIATRNMTTASGTQTIAHGLGEIPKKIKITAINYAAGFFKSFGVYNGTTTSCVVMHDGSLDGSFTSTSNIVYLLNDASPVTGKSQIGVATFDATNIIITWTKTGSPTGTQSFMWEAEV